MLLRHEGKGRGESPLEGEVGKVCFIRKRQLRMSFLRGQVRWHGIYARRFKKQEP